MNNEFIEKLRLIQEGLKMGNLTEEQAHDLVEKLKNERVDLDDLDYSKYEVQVEDAVCHDGGEDWDSFGKYVWSR